jgi:hypothetical protein
VPKGNLLSRYEGNSQTEAPPEVESDKSEKWDKTKLRQTIEAQHLDKQELYWHLLAREHSPTNW